MQAGDRNHNSSGARGLSKRKVRGSVFVQLLPIYRLLPGQMHVSVVAIGADKYVFVEVIEATPYLVKGVWLVTEACTPYIPSSAPHVRRLLGVPKHSGVPTAEVIQVGQSYLRSHAKDALKDLLPISSPQKRICLVSITATHRLLRSHLGKKRRWLHEHSFSTLDGLCEIAAQVQGPAGGAPPVCVSNHCTNKCVQVGGRCGCMVSCAVRRNQNQPLFVFWFLFLVASRAAWCSCACYGSGPALS